MLICATLGFVPASIGSPAQWTSNGVPICVLPDCGGRFPIVCGDGIGGALIAWQTDRDGNEDIYVRRILSNGLLAPGWSVIGTAAATRPGDERLSDIVPDGNGGAFVAWYDWPNYDVAVQHVLGNGQIAPGWHSDGLTAGVSPGAQLNPRLLPDGAGGVFVIWEDGDLYVSASDIYAQHLNGDGTRVTGWPQGGLPVCTSPGLQGGAQFAADGEGGIIAAWGDGRNYYIGEFFAQHITWSGELAAGWPVDGKRIVDALGIGPIRGIVPDGTGGVYFGWQYQHDPYMSDWEVFAIRVLGDGSVAAGWPVAGLRLTPGQGYQQLTSVVADSLGGVLLGWYDQIHPPAVGYVARLRPDGTAAPGWPSSGTRVSDLPGYVLDPHLAPDGAGGCYVAHLATGAGDHGYIQHFSPSGALAMGWPASGVPVVVPTEFYAFQQEELVITPDRSGGAIVAWDDTRNGTQYQIYTQRYIGDGPTPVLVSLVSAQALPDRVVLVWHDPSRAVGDATVYRHRAGEEWSPLAHASFDGTGRLQFEDTAVSPGERYAYRLGWREMVSEYFSAETWVDVPVALALVLEGARPNPAVGSFTVAFSLPRADAATLELLDVAGRRVVAREVGSLGPGQHQIRLGECGCTPPGMYWLRLTNAGRALIKRVAVVK